MDPLSVDDAPFILQLLNEPSFLHYIGDRGVRNLEDARRYLQETVVDSYKRHGFGLWRVRLCGTDTTIGMCGLLKREELDDVDIGFAFLSAYWRQGYATESARAVLSYGKKTWGLQRIVAITQPGNYRSIKTLKTLGFCFEGQVCLADESKHLDVYAL